MNSTQVSPNSKIFTCKLVIRGIDYLLEEVLRENSASSMDEISLVLPQGAYTTFRTYNHNRILRLNAHILRLEESAARIHKPISINPTAFRSGLREILAQNSFPEARLRVTLDLEKEPGDIYISMEQLHTPPDGAYQTGVKTVTYSWHRENAKAKLTGFIRTAAELRSKMPAEINEILMVDDVGSILEGLSSNFFAVVQGKLVSREVGVLSGITRSLVLEIAAALGIPLGDEGISMAQISDLDECFITSASRGVLPVIQIDDLKIGNGRPGPFTRRLMAEFKRCIEQEAQEI